MILDKMITMEQWKAMLTERTLECERLSARVETLEVVIKRALADSETGEGWGPDITVAAYLRAALIGEDK